MMNRIPIGLKKKMTENVSAIINPIPGLYYYPNFLSSNEGECLWNNLQSDSNWVGVTESANARRVIHYGYIYSYTGGKLQKTEPIPLIYSDLIERFQKIIDSENLARPIPQFDQLIINQYLCGQGIAAHIDDISKFDSIIACITLGSGVTINFKKKTGDNNTEKPVTYSLYVEPNSLYIMSGDSRYIWQHAIPHRKKDLVGDLNIPRGKRISLTFRTAIV